MTVDNTFDALEEIESFLESIANHIDTNNDALHQANESVYQLVELSDDPYSPIGTSKNSYNALNYEICSRINDIELGISEARADELFGAFELTPIDIIDSGISVRIEPTSAPKIIFPRRLTASSYHAEMTLRISITISGQDKIQLILLQRICFLNNSDDSISPVMLSAPRFFRSGIEYDPFLKIPVKKQLSVRNKLTSEIKSTLAKNSTRAPSFNLGNILIEIVPSGILIQNRKLIIISKNLGRRKAPEPLLHYITPGYTQALKVRRPFIEKEIRRQVSSRATLNSITFNNGFIRISTTRSDRKDILHIKVTTWVRIDYRLFLTVSNRTNLLMDSRWAEWEYKIKAHRCWPVCNKVLKFAKSIVMREINKNKYFTQHLADLGRYAFRIRTRVTKFGIQLDMKAKP